MQKNNFRILIAVFIISVTSIFLFSCGSSEYIFKEPIVQNNVKISGLEKNHEITEVSDCYKGNVLTENECWIVVEDYGDFYVGKLNLNDGIVSGLTKMTNYKKEDNTIYWNSITEDGTGTFQEVINFLGPETREYYYMFGLKNIWGNTKESFVLEYNYNFTKEITESNVLFDVISETENYSLKEYFDIDGRLYHVKTTSGYSSGFDEDNMIGKKIRILKINNDTYLSVQPEDIPSASKVTYVVFKINKATNTAKSYGARVEYDYEYIDAVVSKDGSKLGLLFYSSDGVVIKYYDAAKFANNVKSYRID